jgi:hypothetical protein
MKILVVGATGTLGRQIVRDLLTTGYEVKCLVRNLRKADFLRGWGAELSYGDLTIPETIPLNLKGINIIIDASTLRTDDELGNVEQVDVLGKIALIKAAKISGIEKFIFFSIAENENSEQIQILKAKQKIEETLKQSNLEYNIIQLSGFYQGLINQYAIPILEKQVIFTTDESEAIGYVDAQDISKICSKLISLNVSNNNSNFIRINEAEKLKQKQLIELCETLSGQKRNVIEISPNFLMLFSFIISTSRAGWAIADRLSFREININQKLEKYNKLKSENKIKNIVKVTKNDLVTVENYFDEYFEGLLKKLKDLNYDQQRAAKRKDLTF